MNFTQRNFACVFSADTTLPLTANPEWNNGTSYFDGAVYDDVLKNPGDIGRFTTPMPNNRSGLIIKTRFGNVVLFERFTPNTDNPMVYVANMPRMVQRLLKINGSIDENAMGCLIGNMDGNTNIGRLIEEMCTMSSSETFVDPMELRAKRRKALAA